MVDVMCNLIGLRGAQTAGKTLFLGVFAILFLEEIAFESVD